MISPRAPYDARPLSCPGCGGPLDPNARACPSCGATAGTRRCASCLGLSLAGDRNCRSCGALLPLEKELDEEKPLPCAGCGAKVTRRVAGAALFDECDHCGGLWLPTTTWEAVATQAETRSWLRSIDDAQGRPASEEPDRIAYRPCPRCRKMMNRARFALGSGVVLDVCKDHGTYFDRGEMTRVCAFIESGGLERARKRESQALKEEVRDARRKAIAIAGGDRGFEPGPRDLPSGSGFDLLRTLADLMARRV